METINLPNDIKVFYVKAKSYPDGIQDSHDKLRELVKDLKDRKFFGLSRPEENGAIRYKAAAEERFRGEAEKLHCETLIIKKGKYTSIEINDYMKDLPSIGRAFDELLRHPKIDPQGYCVEWYVSDQKVICMVRLDE